MQVETALQKHQRTHFDPFGVVGFVFLPARVLQHKRFFWLPSASSCVELFFFHPDALPPVATPSPRGGGVAVSGQLILAPTGSGKSTWRSLAPIYCPLGDSPGRGPKLEEGLSLRQSDGSGGL